MEGGIQTIPAGNLAVAFIPVAIVVIILKKWSMQPGNALYAIARMLGQLLLIGYCLVYIFKSDNAWIVAGVLAVMLFSSSWIALRTVKGRRRTIYGRALLSIALGGGLTLMLITMGVLQLQPWYLPQFMIPLAGMIFANAMNSVSLAVERLYAEFDRTGDLQQARVLALRAALIPITNTLFAVGLVSIPGMMTGQILSGISPLVAVRYQIMVMCMVFGAAGISSACVLVLLKPGLTEKAVAA
jgi:putative ABC transport system permease protein